MAKALTFIMLGMLLATVLQDLKKRTFPTNHKLKCIQGGIG